MFSGKAEFDDLLRKINREMMNDILSIPIGWKRIGPTAAHERLPDGELRPIVAEIIVLVKSKK